MSLEEVSVPQFECQKYPEAAGMAATTGQVLIQQLLHSLRLKVTPLHRAWLEQQFQQVSLQFPSHPMHKWHPKALFGSIENFPRHAEAFTELLQNVLFPPVSELPVRRQRCHPLQEHM